MDAGIFDEIGKCYTQDNIIIVIGGAGWHRSKDIVLPAKSPTALLVALQLRVRPAGLVLN